MTVFVAFQKVSKEVCRAGIASSVKTSNILDELNDVQFENFDQYSATWAFDNTTLLTTGTEFGLLRKASTMTAFLSELDDAFAKVG